MKEENYINDRFESHVRETISQHRSAFDGEKMWEILDGQIPGPKNKRRFGWIWLTGLLLIGFLSGYLFVHHTQSPPIQSVSNGTLTPSESHELKARQNPNLSGLIATQEHFQSNTQNSKVDSREDIVTSAQAERSTPQKSAGTTKTIPTDGNENRHNQNVNSKKTSVSGFIGPVQPKIQSPTPPMASLSKGLKRNTQSADYATDRIPTLNPEFDGARMFSIDHTPELSYALSTHNPGWDWMIKATGSIQKTINHWSGNLESEKWIEARRETEKPLETIEAGIGIGLIAPNNLSIESGIGFAVQNEIFKYQITEEQTRLEPTTLHPEDVMTDTIIRTINYVTESSSRRVRNYNQRSLLRIPLNVGYRQAVKGWILGGAIGLTLNVPLQASGRSLSPQMDVANWEEPSEWKYRTTPYLGYSARAEIGREIIPGLILSLETQFHHSNANILQTELDATQSQSSYGLQLGLTKIL